MTQPTSRPPGPSLPRWMALPASLLIAYHLGSVLLNVLAAPSGPWPNMEGPEMAAPPQLAAWPHQEGALPYLRAIKQTHNYHFRSNRGGQPDAYLQIQLYDKDGVLSKTLRFPDPKASSALQQRQAMVCRWFTDDQPVQPNMGEQIPAPNAKIPEISIWESVQGDPRKLALTRIPENEVPRDRQVFRPSSWSLIVLRSLARHWCRQYEAHSAEITRHSREAIPPRILSERENPPEMEELQSNYGRLPR